MPLIVLTADRPPELREVGAGQAIDQLKLYGSAAKWFVEVGTHEPGRETAVHHRALACRAYWTARGGRPGPVHLNFPLREPLAPVPEELDAADWAGRPDGRPWTELREHASAPHADDVHGSPARIAGAPRGAIVCGPGARHGGRARRRGWPPQAGWPLLAEPTSGVRCGRPRPLARGRALRRAPARGGLRGAPPARAGAAGRATCPPRSRCAPWLAGAAGGARPARRLARAHPPGRADPAAAAAPDPRRARRGARDAARASRIPAGSPRGAPPTTLVPAALADAPEPSSPSCSRAVEPELPGRRGRLAQLVDAGARRGGLLPAVAQADPLPRQPRRQRDRRRDLLGARRGPGHRRAHLAPHRRARAPARPGRPVRRAPCRRAARGRLHRQRRRRDLRLPAGGRARRPASSTSATSPPRRAPRCATRSTRCACFGATALATSRSTVSWWSG